MLGLSIEGVVYRAKMPTHIGLAGEFVCWSRVSTQILSGFLLVKKPMRKLLEKCEGFA